jgi:hypothetical protein
MNLLPPLPTASDPLNVVMGYFMSRGLFLHWDTAQQLADLNMEFAKLIRESSQYASLVAAGVDSETLVDVCSLFHALSLLHEYALADFRKRHLLKKGRPADLSVVFQWACDMLVNRRTDGRRFYAEFSGLAALVYRKPNPVSPESYCRTLMRFRAKARGTLVNCEHARR